MVPITRFGQFIDHIAAIMSYSIDEIRRRLSVHASRPVIDQTLPLLHRSSPPRRREIHAPTPVHASTAQSPPSRQPKNNPFAIQRILGLRESDSEKDLFCVGHTVGDNKYGQVQSPQRNAVSNVNSSPKARSITIDNEAEIKLGAANAELSFWAQWRQHVTSLTTLASPDKWIDATLPTVGKGRTGSTESSLSGCGGFGINSGACYMPGQAGDPQRSLKDSSVHLSRESVQISDFSSKIH